MISSSSTSGPVDSSSSAASRANLTALNKRSTSMAVAQKGFNCITSNFLGQTFTADQVRIKFRKIEGETPKVRICSMIGPWHFVGFKHVQALYQRLATGLPQTEITKILQPTTEFPSVPHARMHPNISFQKWSVSSHHNIHIYKIITSSWASSSNNIHHPFSWGSVAHLS